MWVVRHYSIEKGAAAISEIHFDSYAAARGHATEVAISETLCNIGTDLWGFGPVMLMILQY
jgi:hypothetical protein